jgi:hypothetical protein
LTMAEGKVTLAGLAGTNEKAFGYA